MRNIHKKLVAIVTTIVCTCSFNTMLINAEWISDERNPNVNDSVWFGGTPTCYNENGAGTHCYHRRKYNATSIYVKNLSSKNVKIDIYGEFDMYNSLKGDVANDYSGSLLKVNTKDVTIPGNSERFVQQFINENGYSYAHLHFKTADTFGGWSPDSIGYYPSAN